MATILDFRSCDIWEHFYVHRWIDHTLKHGIRHQDHLSRLNNTQVMRVFNFGYFGWRPYWIWPKKVPSRFFPPGILIDLVNRPPKGNNYVGFKTIPIFSRSNSIFMRLHVHIHNSMMVVDDIDTATWRHVNSLTPGRWGDNIKSVISVRMMYIFISRALLVKLLSYECHIPPCWPSTDYGASWGQYAWLSL